jgi:hypothetical protein
VLLCFLVNAQIGLLLSVSSMELEKRVYAPQVEAGEQNNPTRK